MLAIVVVVVAVVVLLLVVFRVQFDRKCHILLRVDTKKRKEKNSPSPFSTSSLSSLFTSSASKSLTTSTLFRSGLSLHVVHLCRILSRSSSHYFKCLSPYFICRFISLFVRTSRPVFCLHLGLFPFKSSSFPFIRHTHTLSPSFFLSLHVVVVFGCAQFSFTLHFRRTHTHTHTHVDPAIVIQIIFFFFSSFLLFSSLSFPQARRSSSASAFLSPYSFCHIIPFRSLVRLVAPDRFHSSSSSVQPFALLALLLLTLQPMSIAFHLIRHFEFAKLITFPASKRLIVVLSIVFVIFFSS